MVPLPSLADQLQLSLGGAYRIERELGGGGMSRVFVALDKSLNRLVVVKVLPHELAASLSAERFKREIALAARLQHPHIVPLLSAGDTEGLPYFTMPFIEGETLRARLARVEERSLPVAEAMRILREVASALDYAHEKGVVHRDIKPDNVLVAGDSAMVTDFGVAKALSASSDHQHSGLTSLGVALGTPAYMSPEQASASPTIDARADLYAFGMMAYELFAGRAPFAGRTPQAMVAAHLTEAPEPIQKLRPGLPPAVAALIMRCLEKSPEDRPQSAAEIVRTLDSITTVSGGVHPTGAIPTRPSRAIQPTRSTRHVTSIAVGFVAGIAVVAFVAASVNRHGRQALRASSAGAPQRSIAVVPFVGGDPKDEYFADGVADELTSMLARIPDLGVAAHSSAFAFKAKPLSSRQIGESLHVSTVVEGTVRRAESRIRITAALINVANGLTLWSDSYDRDPKDVFTVQQEIAERIAGQLRVTLGAATVSRGGTKNPEAHDLYLQAMFHSYRLTEPEQRSAIELYGKAIALDSNFAEAWAGLSVAWSVLSGDWIAPAEGGPKAQAAARRALALDPGSAEPHAAMAVSAFLDLDWPTALREAQTAVRLEPSFKGGLEIYGYTLLSLAAAGASTPALRDTAMAVTARTLALDPRDPVITANLCNVLLGRADYPRAAVQCKRGVDLDPGSPDAALALANFYASQRRWDDALRAAAMAAASPDRMSVALAHLNISAGRSDEARRILARLVADARTRYVRPDAIAGVYLHLGDAENTIAWLERAEAARSPSLVRFDFSNPLIKDDARVKKVRAELAARWKRMV